MGEWTGTLKRLATLVGRLGRFFSRPAPPHQREAKGQRGNLAVCSIHKYRVEKREEMATVTPYFETVKSFADVPVTSDGVETASFLDASDGLVNMFDLLGVGVFSFVQHDLRTNIGGVRSRHASHHQVSTTLEMLVTSEAGEGTRQSTACLVRLIRGLLFTCRALENMQADHSSELRACFKRSYDDVLRHHHGWLIQSAVTLAIRAVPSRSEFYRRISQGGSYENLDAELAKWLKGLNQIVVRMKRFLAEGGYGTV